MGLLNKLFGTDVTDESDDEQDDEGVDEPHEHDWVATEKLGWVPYPDADAYAEIDESALRIPAVRKIRVECRGCDEVHAALDESDCAYFSVPVLSHESCDIFYNRDAVTEFEEDWGPTVRSFANVDYEYDNDVAELTERVVGDR